MVVCRHNWGFQGLWKSGHWSVYIWSRKKWDLSRFSRDITHGKGHKWINKSLWVFILVVSLHHGCNRVVCSAVGPIRTMMMSFVSLEFCIFWGACTVHVTFFTYINILNFLFDTNVGIVTKLCRNTSLPVSLWKVPFISHTTCSKWVIRGMRLAEKMWWYSACQKLQIENKGT